MRQIEKVQDIPIACPRNPKNGRQKTLIIVYSERSIFEQNVLHPYFSASLTGGIREGA